MLMAIKVLSYLSTLSTKFTVINIQKKSETISNYLVGLGRLTDEVKILLFIKVSLIFNAVCRLAALKH